MTTPWAPAPPPYRHGADCALRNGGACSCRPRAMERLAGPPRPPRHLDPGYDLGSGAACYDPQRRSRWRLRRMGSAAARWAAPWWFLTWCMTWGRQGKPLLVRETYYVGLCGCPECGDAEVELLRQGFHACYTGTQNAGKVLVLGPGARYERCPQRGGDTNPVTGNMGTR